MMILRRVWWTAIRGQGLFVIAGRIDADGEAYQQLGIADAAACRKEGMSLDYALENSRTLLYDAASELAERLRSKIETEGCFGSPGKLQYHAILESNQGFSV